jgi:hypothetical protein
VKAVNSCLGVLLSVCASLKFLSTYLPNIQAYQTVKGVIDSYDTLVDLLESIEHFLKRLDIYTKIPPTVPMTDMVIKILTGTTLSPRVGDQADPRGESE